MSAARVLLGAVGLCLTLGGCGFQLRDSYAVPAFMAVTYLDGDPRSPLVAGLERALRASEVRLAAEPPAAGAVLRVFGETTGRSVLSVTSNARVSEYEVFYAVSFTLQASPGEGDGASAGDEPEVQTLRLTRDYVFDAEGVLASGDEEATLIEEMRRDLVRLIMLRLRALAQEPQPG